MNAVIESFIEQLTAILRRSQQRGEIDGAVSTRSLAFNLFGLYQNLLQLRHGGYIDYDRLIERLRAAFELQLLGITATEQPRSPE